MIGSSNEFFTYNSIILSPSVIFANRTSLKVLGFETTQLSPNVSSSFALFGPQFLFSLMSLSKITHSLNCSVTFYPSSVSGSKDEEEDCYGA